MDQQFTRPADAPEPDDDCGNVEHERPPGVPPADNDDLDGHDQSVGDSFPASDPPATY
jgi:hypothetical protein